MPLQELDMLVTHIEMGFVTVLRRDTKFRIPMRTDELVKLKIGETVTLTLTKKELP